MATSINNLGITFPDGLTQTSKIQSGLIFMWYGNINNIPSGWRICDGTNSTPDLRNRFIVGAGSTYPVGSTGGCANSALISHTHDVTISPSGLHNHLYPTESTTHCHLYYGIQTSSYPGFTDKCTHDHFILQGGLDICQGGCHNHNFCFNGDGYETNGLSSCFGHAHCVRICNGGVHQHELTAFPLVNSGGNCGAVNHTHELGTGYAISGVCCGSTCGAIIPNWGGPSSLYISAPSGEHQHATFITCSDSYHIHTLANSNSHSHFHTIPVDRSMYGHMTCRVYDCTFSNDQFHRQRNFVGALGYEGFSSSGVGNIYHCHAIYISNVTYEGEHCHTFVNINTAAVEVSSAGSHAHSISYSSTGTNQVNGNLPPYYALVYLMKI